MGLRADHAGERGPVAADTLLGSHCRRHNPTGSRYILIPNTAGPSNLKTNFPSQNLAAQKLEEKKLSNTYVSLELIIQNCAIQR